MAASEGLLGDLAGAVLDGTPIDWASAESRANETERPFLDQFRQLATLAALHRGLELPQDEAERSWALAAATLTATADRVEDQWGHLRVLERIGRGACGEVYRAWDTRLDREVALKLLPTSAADESHATSIIEEGRLLARVRHPNVVTIYGAERIADQVGLWMEFVRGRTLEQLLEQGRVFRVAEVVDIGVELCHAVSAVHSAGLLHRDIKAHNVMLAEDGRVVLMDFGTGRELAAPSAAGLAGTPLYLAPEVLGGEDASIRSDIYGVGVLLYHLLTASYPVRARTLRDLRLAHERHEQTDVRTARPDASPELARIIERAIDAQPERRYASADSVAAVLAALKPRLEPAPAGARVRWTRRLGLAAGFVLLAVAVSDSPTNVRARPALDAREWLLIGAIGGTTGDRDLEATLQQAVIAELEKSPYLNVFPAARVREALDRMKRPAETTIEESVGLEICAREGLAAMVTGSVETLGGLYLVRLRATHAATKAVLVSAQESRRSREETLEAALTMTRRLRQQLGETLASVQATSPPLEPVTSQSFEAVRRFTLGKQLYEAERPREALPHFLDAIASDSDFAMAYEYAALAYSYLGEYDKQRQFLETAAALASDPASPVGQIEREKILADRDVYLERFHEAAGHWHTLLSLRPGDGRALANLGLVYGSIRQYQESIAALEAAWQAYPHPRVRWMLADMYSAAGRPEAAAQLSSQHLDQPFDWIAFAKHLLVAGRRDEAEAALGEAERRFNQAPDASWSDLALAQADFYRSEGRYREAEDALQQGLDRGGRAGVERLELAMASLFVDWGRRGEAAAHLGRIDVQLARNRIVHGVLLARAGDVRTAAAVLDRLEQDAQDRRAPRPEARVHQLRAELALAGGRAADAHAHAARAVRAFTTAWTLETLARTQQAAGMISEAITTWTTILERPGERTIDWDAPAFSRVVLAEYELARLLQRRGQLEAARDRYDDFLRRWDRADPALAVYVDARDRRRRLGQGAQSMPSGRVPKPAT